MTSKSNTTNQERKCETCMFYKDNNGSDKFIAKRCDICLNEDNWVGIVPETTNCEINIR